MQPLLTTSNANKHFVFNTRIMLSLTKAVSPSIHVQPQLLLPSSIQHSAHIHCSHLQKQCHQASTFNPNCCCQAAFNIQHTYIALTYKSSVTKHPRSTLIAAAKQHSTFSTNTLLSLTKAVSPSIHVQPQLLLPSSIQHSAQIHQSH
jgi:hypothetical protein